MKKQTLYQRNGAALERSRWLTQCMRDLIMVVVIAGPTFIVMMPAQFAQGVFVLGCNAITMGNIVRQSLTHERLRFRTKQIREGFDRGDFRAWHGSVVAGSQCAGLVLIISLIYIRSGFQSAGLLSFLATIIQFRSMWICQKEDRIHLAQAYRDDRADDAWDWF